EAGLQGQLLDRKRRLENAIAGQEDVQHFVRLLSEVDAALDRMGNGTYGVCEVCEEAIDEQELVANPLMRYCLCELSEEELSALSDDLDLAWRIQAALLPRPELQGAGWDFHYRYEPLGPVSGDYCDLLTHAEQNGDVFFLVADVSGKGVAASLVMAHLNALFRSLVGLDLPVTQLVERANRQLVESTIASHYATLVCGWARASGEIEICNAGHCPPLLLRGGTVESLGATGTPIGMLRDQVYESKTLQLDKGDTLFLYTDGLTEARNANGAMYEAERLQRLLYDKHNLHPRFLAQACLADLAIHLAGAPRTDDLTLLILRRTDA
ncbi:MAG: SpoIIE family protein phosphatase, partial [Candidatus Latescibacterota bacterium]